MDTASDAHSISFKGATPIWAVPKYIFTKRKDFEDFQSELRGKRLVGTFEVRKIESAVSTKFGEATDQHLKIWKDYATKECSISFYASAISKPRHREFPLAMLEQELGFNKKVKEELRLNFIRGPPEPKRARTVSKAFSRSPSEATTWTDTTGKSGPLIPSSHRLIIDLVSAVFTAQPTEASSSASSITTINSRTATGLTYEQGIPQPERSPTGPSLKSVAREMKFLVVTFSDEIGELSSLWVHVIRCLLTVMARIRAIQADI
jgi:hypothetical protein